MEDFILGFVLAILAYLFYTKKITLDSIAPWFRKVVPVIPVEVEQQDDNTSVKRVQIITEILQTERYDICDHHLQLFRTYNKSLNSLLLNYIEPLQSEKTGSTSPVSSPKLGFLTRTSPVLTKDEIKTIFLVPSLESIVQLSNTILSKYFASFLRL
jgi:hypothetical protein